MRKKIMDRKGLSSDCTLAPMIALGIQMEGREHPCDRCNENRDICRGFPRKSDQKIEVPHRLKYIRITACPSPEVRGREIRVDIDINGERRTQLEQYPDDFLNSDFDRIWESMGRKLKNALAEPAGE